VKIFWLLGVSKVLLPCIKPKTQESDFAQATELVINHFKREADNDGSLNGVARLPGRSLNRQFKVKPTTS
jgi:hypothetical protein